MEPPSPDPGLGPGPVHSHLGRLTGIELGQQRLEPPRRRRRQPPVTAGMTNQQPPARHGECLQARYRQAPRRVAQAFEVQPGKILEQGVGLTGQRRAAGERRAGMGPAGGQ